MSLFFHPSKRWCDLKCLSCGGDCRNKLNWVEETAAGVLFLVVCLGIGIFCLLNGLFGLVVEVIRLLIAILSTGCRAIIRNPFFFIIIAFCIAWATIWWSIMWFWAPIK